MSEVQKKNLPDFLKRHLKERKFNKLKIKVDLKDVARVYPNQHAPQYDNFDYSYYDLADLNTRSVQSDLQNGVKSEHKEVHLDQGKVLITGDRISGYAYLFMNEDTFNKHFNDDLKSVSEMLKGAALELLRLKEKY